MLRPKVKICCISSIEEARLAINSGANDIGLVGNMPSGPGIIDDNLIREIAKNISPPISTFLLTSEIEATQIISHHKRVNTTTIQLVDKIERGAFEQIRKELPKVKLVQVIHVVDDKSILEAKEAAPYVDAILLDSGNPKLAIKELGGTGRTHNWELSRAIKDAISIPLYLAGGLNQDNVIKAIETVRPDGIDLCSGVRTDGKLDHIKLSGFFDRIEQYYKAP